MSYCVIIIRRVAKCKMYARVHCCMPCMVTIISNAVLSAVAYSIAHTLYDKHDHNKNLAIANRSRVSCINTNNNTMTLKSGLEVTQDH